MRTLNLKFICAVLFAVIFLAGGLFINTAKVSAETTVKTYTVTYTLSSVTSFANKDGGTTTVVRVGCASGSKDLYDINTGKKCSPQVFESTRVGCAAFSKDLFDINTGKPCTNKSTPVLKACVAGSGDLYDVTNGKRCENAIKPVLTGCKAGSSDLFNTIDGKPCPKVAGASTLQLSTGQNTASNGPSPVIAQAPQVINPTGTTPVLDSEGSTETANRGEEQSNILSANAGKIGSIFNGPMSIWLILLIAIIIVAGGFAIYGFMNKSKKEEEETTPVKPAQTKLPNAQTPPATSTMQVNSPAQPVNKTPTPVNTAPNTNPINTHHNIAQNPTQETLLKK